MGSLHSRKFGASLLPGVGLPGEAGPACHTANGEARLALPKRAVLALQSLRDTARHHLPRNISMPSL
eukprot:scaffold554617_cov31-Prasinocladus_malaysianus.AAC.1